ncbi:YvrJ family protein [Desulfitobacterium sp. Sab5]|uniref:YvrJ family protein n=1 Tax=Desulfitobacterium nosdiversum TaxID=3375356 RepID=UPI003CF53C9F
MKNSEEKEKKKRGKREGRLGVEEILKLVGNFGFPIVVSAYLLVRIEGKLNELSASITELAKAIAVLEVRGEVK